MSPSKAPSTPVAKCQIRRKKVIASSRKSLGQARVVKEHHAAESSRHLTLAQLAEARVASLTGVIGYHTKVQNCSKTAEVAAKRADVDTVLYFLREFDENLTSPIVTGCAHLVVDLYQAQGPVKDHQMKGYQVASGFNSARFLEVKAMALRHDLLVENECDNTCSINPDFDELLYSVKSSLEEYE